MSDRRPPKTGPGEKAVLTGFLDYLRAAVATKAGGVPEAQARAAGVPSGTNLLGLVKHLTHVERRWLLGDDVADWQATFHAGPDETAATILAGYRRDDRRSERRNRFLGPHRAHPVDGGRPPWTLTHLIEETARHAGHADILRELIDGATGR